MRTVNQKAASLRHASRELCLSREKLKTMALAGEISCVNSDPWQFNMEVLRREIEVRKNRIMAEMKKAVR